MATDNAELPSTALVVGGQGGIGSALLRLWQKEQRYAQLFGSSRRSEAHWSGSVHGLILDMQDHASIQAFAGQVEQALNGQHLDTLCVCSGVLHCEQFQPEKRMADLSADAFQRVMQINALGPLLLLQQLIKFLPRQRLSRVMVLSARVGSIADNRLGGWLSYRSSKAALNQGLKTLAIELRRTHPHCVVTAYHPGTVDTGLSQPFQRRVPAGQLFTADDAAAKLSGVLHARTDPNEHLFVDWAGQSVSF